MREIFFCFFAPVTKYAVGIALSVVLSYEEKKLGRDEGTDGDWTRTGDWEAKLESGKVRNCASTLSLCP